MDWWKDVWWKDVIEEHKDDCWNCNRNWNEDEGALLLNFIKHSDKVNDDIVKYVIAGMDKPQCDKVRSIELNLCQITDAALTTIGDHCRHLTTLHLYKCVEVTDEGIAAIIRNNPNIKYLSFSDCNRPAYCNRPTSASIDAVIEHCPDFEELHAQNGWVGLTSLPDNIGNLSKLKHLNLGNNSITTLPLSIGNLPKDCYLNFNGNPIKNVPFSTIEKGPAAINRFFKLKEKEGAAESNLM